MPGTIPKLMNAVWYETNGDAADVLVHGEMPVPQSAAGEVLVRLGASGRCRLRRLARYLWYAPACSGLG